MMISKEKSTRIKSLIAECKLTQGAYLESHHGSGSWATTYSNEFINSACELYLLYKSFGLGDPLIFLSRQFCSAGIRSCRGAEFDIARLEYLYSTHMRHRLDELEKKNVPICSKVTCLYCLKKVVDLTQHISQAHPEFWEEYFAQNNIDLKGKSRCLSCGSFLKRTEGHQEKCLRTLEKRNE